MEYLEVIYRSGHTCHGRFFFSSKQAQEEVGFLIVWRTQIENYFERVIGNDNLKPREQSIGFWRKKDNDKEIRVPVINGSFCSKNNDQWKWSSVLKVSNTFKFIKRCSMISMISLEDVNWSKEPLR